MAKKVSYCGFKLYKVSIKTKTQSALTVIDVHCFACKSGDIMYINLRSVLGKHSKYNIYWHLINDMGNVLANSCLLTHPEDMEQH